MRTLLRNATLWLALALLGFPATTTAQTQIDHTTLSVAMTSTSTTIDMAAASGSAVGEHVFVEGELMQLINNAGDDDATTFGVRRGLANGFTPARPHPTTAIVWVLDAEEGKTFNVAGTCTATSERFLPHINTKENRIFDCSGGYWIERDRDRVNVLLANTVCGGKLKCREEFNGGHLVMQDDGTAKSLADAEENFVYGSPLGAIEYREEQAKTTSSWVTINGELDIDADGTTANEGVEIVFGASSDAALNQVLELGTHGACISARIEIADISGVNDLFIGWRQNEAWQDGAVHTGYDDWAVIGLQDNAGDLDIEDEEAGGGTQNDDTGVTWADAEERALKVCINSAGEPDFFYTANLPDNEEPLYTQVTTTNTGDALTSGDGFVPFLIYRANGTDDPGIRIHWVQIEYAP